MPSQSPPRGTERPLNPPGVGASTDGGFLDDERPRQGEDFLFHLYRGSELLEDNRIREAKDELARAFAIDSEDPKVTGLLATACFRLGQYSEALRLFEQLRSMGESDETLSLNLSLCYLKTSQLTLAMSELESLTGANPDHKRAWGYLGLVYERLALFDKAERAFTLSGHVQLAARMAARRRDVSEVQSHAPPVRSGDKSDSAAPELDGGQFSFQMAEPHGDVLAHSRSRGTVAPQPWVKAEAHVPILGSVPSGPRRPTLMAKAPDVGFGHATKVPPPPRPMEENLIPYYAGPSRTFSQRFSGDLAPLAPEFTSEPGVTVASGAIAYITIDPESGFYVAQSAVKVVVGKPKASLASRKTGEEPLGGFARPFVHYRGEGKLVVYPEDGSKLFRFSVGATPAFFIASHVLGFEGELVHEAGDVHKGALSLLQFKGKGTVLAEVGRDAMAIDLAGDSERVLVRREQILGWLGRLGPTAVTGEDGYTVQRGLYAFSGTGTVFVLVG